MKSCGLESESSSYNLEVLTANRSITMENLSKTNGHTCYFTWKLNSSWTEDTKFVIYPSLKDNVDVYLVEGKDRKIVKTKHTLVLVDSAYEFYMNNEVYLIVAAKSDTNKFSFKYSVRGSLVRNYSFWDWLTSLSDDEAALLWSSVGVVICIIFCCAYYFYNYNKDRTPKILAKEVALEAIKEEEREKDV